MFLFSFFFFFMRLSTLNSYLQDVIIKKLSKFFLSHAVFLLVVSLVVLNNLLDIQQEIIFFGSNSDYIGSTYTLSYSYTKLVNNSSLSLNLIDVYLYPFIYVFLIITVLSIVFCLTYNKDELMSFMFYCQIILIAGYVLFFTESLIIFFFAYEMLLVPSFFILYKFAKTRRCIEAAYLMFF